MDLIRIIDSNDFNKNDLSSYIPRSQSQIGEIKDSVQKIIEEVRINGDDALVKLTKEFDGISLDLSEVCVSKYEIEESYKKIDNNLLDSLRYAKKNLMKFHQAQMERLKDWNEEIEKGVIAGQIYRSIDSVGIYIPGGRAIYPSTVLMALAPARIANVPDIIICSPPQKDGKIAPEILVAASEFGLKKIFKVGGAQAIAAMAYGTKIIPQVQKIIGPGNKWVNAAKQLLSNVVAIDTPAGPSEVCIIADQDADHEHVIIDLLSQVEHDPDNVGIVLTDSPNLIEKVTKSLKSFVEKSKRKDIMKQALKNNSLIIKARDIDECIEISNLIAPEHLELLIKKPKKYLDSIKNAGAIFIGPYSPVPLGDYSAGTNHILPTGGNARKYSGLNVLSFIKVIDLLNCSFEGLKNLSNSAMKIAEFEGLFAHKESIEKRLEDKN